MEMKTVVVFGTFDMVHEGHRFFFKEARRHGDKLIALIARDKTVAKMKGHAPVNDESRRMEDVLATGLVDEAFLGSNDDYYACLDRFRPDVICLGYDQNSTIANALQHELSARGLHTKIVHLPPYKEDIYKSSRLKKKSTSDNV